MINTFLVLMLIAGGAFVFTSCEEEETGAPPVIERVRLVPKDSTTNSGSRYEFYAIMGKNLSSVQAVFFGGERAPLNATMVRDDNIIISIPGDAPFPGPNVLSTVRVVTRHGEAQMTFEIEQPDPEIHSFAPAVAAAGESVTISGAFFNGLESVSFVDAESDEEIEAEIVAHTADEETGDEEIIIIVPEDVKVSYISITTQAGTGLSESTFGLNYFVATEGLNSEIENWSWGGVDDFSSDAVSKSGLYSYKRTYNDGWSGVQLHHGSLDLTQFEAFKFSVYGGPNTSGKQVQFTLNWGTMVQITVTEGEWTDYTIPLSDVDNPETLGEIIFQDNGNTDPPAPFLIYFDDMGFI